MKKFIVFVLALALLIPSVGFAASYVRGYYRSTGTYVPSYYRSTRDSYKFNNYSSKGSYNPYSGKKGYKSWY